MLATDLLRQLKRTQRVMAGTWQPAWITADIAVSGVPAAHHRRELLAAGVTSIVNLRDGQRAGLQLNGEAAGATVRVNVPTREGLAPSPPQLDSLTAWVKARIEQGRVLIYCREGRGLNDLVACATLVRMGFSAATAYALASQNHRRMHLSDVQYQALQSFAHSWESLEKGI